MMLHLDDFILYLTAERRYSKLTARAYHDDIEQFALLCGKTGDNVTTIDPAMVTAGDLREWIMSMSEAKPPMAATSINRKISSVKAFFRYLRKRNIIDNDIFAHIHTLKKPQRLPTFIEQSRMRRIVATLLCPTENFTTERDSLIILMLYATGIRLAELLGIHLNDFQENFNTLKVRGKGDKERIIPVSAPLKAKILHYIKLIKSQNICNDDNFSLILTQQGEPIGRTEVYNIVRGVLKAAGVQGKSSPHVLRHTFATHLMDKDADIRSIQELLGHSSLAATQIYTHNNIEQLKKVYTNAHPRANKTTNKK